MAFKTFAPGVLTSSDVNTFLMRQAVITCTSSTRPASPSEGMTIYETDTDLYRTYSGSAWETSVKPGAWSSYTPTTTGWSIGNGSIVGKYSRVGRTVFVVVEALYGSTTTVTSEMQVSVPFAVAARTNLAPVPYGQVVWTDDSAGRAIIGTVARVSSAANLAFYVVDTAVNPAGNGLTGPSSPFAPASADTFAAAAVYQTTDA